MGGTRRAGSRAHGLAMGAAVTYPVRPRGPLDARVRVPGSRSVTNRALVCAALADGDSMLRGALESDDMRRGVRALGARVDVSGDTWRVRGTGGKLVVPDGPLFVGASGTTARFLTAVATLAPGPVEIDGSARMRERPIVDLVRALRALGAEVAVLGRNGCPPLRTHGGGLAGGEAAIDAHRSSQYVSAVLLAAPCARRPVTLTFAGGVLVSAPYVELTLDVMRTFGARADWRPEGGLSVPADAGYRAADHRVEPDASSAAYAFAAAAIAGGRVRVDGLSARSHQADVRLLDVLEAMGCGVVRGDDFVEVTGPSSALRPVDVDMNPMPDAALALAVVALFASGPSRLRNIANLRIKETDRLHALETELRRLGAGATADADSLEIQPGPLRGATVETYDDHRMAMAFALAGLRVPGVAIRDPDCVAKTWPDYFRTLERL